MPGKGYPPEFRRKVLDLAHGQDVHLLALLKRFPPALQRSCIRFRAWLVSATPGRRYALRVLRLRVVSSGHQQEDAGAPGRCRVKVEPSPGALVAVMVPPWASAIA
ncbi:hypothetical protein GCM10010156_77920 [Planobispora rosea]|uniref:Transposase n=1 Tax=Planobispora rosea TaxID=35762 RepID=A0A8J3S8H6_PLARO|nr:hypothetical protein GCM10010156_77920 [Planobispora rosea]GIH89303.1 hypothetical protein Pro02_77110 [Planobispora rosea]